MLNQDAEGDLAAFGWNRQWKEKFEAVSQAGDVPARVTAVFGPTLRVFGAEGEMTGQLAGSLQRARSDPSARPTTGDWVVCRTSGSEMVVTGVLPRRTACDRTAPNGRIQVVAANLDLLFVVMGVDNDFSPRRLERYLLLAFGSGASPVVVLNKMDLAEDLEERKTRLEPLLHGVCLHAISALHGDGMEELQPYLKPAVTIALLGSSGAGKSTLVNRLLGREAQKTRAVRDGDDRGRHTTTHRELFRLPGGALLLDTPGLREVQPSGQGGGIELAFADIDQLSADCRFRDCRHGQEPECAVLNAIQAGELAPERLRSFLGLLAEQARQHELKEIGAAKLQRKRWRKKE